MLEDSTIVRTVLHPTSAEVGSVVSGAVSYYHGVQQDHKRGVGRSNKFLHGLPSEQLSVLLLILNGYTKTDIWSTNNSISLWPTGTNVVRHYNYYTSIRRSGLLNIPGLTLPGGHGSSKAGDIAGSVGRTRVSRALCARAGHWDGWVRTQESFVRAVG
jgi:hypothetical protein